VEGITAAAASMLMDFHRSMQRRRRKRQSLDASAHCNEKFYNSVHCDLDLICGRVVSYLISVGVEGGA